MGCAGSKAVTTVDGKPAEEPAAKKEEITDVEDAQSAAGDAAPAAEEPAAADATEPAAEEPAAAES